MKLAQLAVGHVARIDRVGGERAFRRRLMELGLVPGTRVEFRGVAPLGDPIELLVRGTGLSIRRAEAEAISVATEALAAAPSEDSERVLTVESAPSVPSASLNRGAP
jgi:ferrous iron transport protein A